MKKSNSIIAIITMAILVTAVAVVSCKKETEKALNPKTYNVQQSIDYRQIEDKLTYFEDFRQKMMESKGDEAYNLEDAAWHLACLANFDFCKVNVEYNDVQFDTVEMQVNVTDGVVLLSDLNAAYEQMCTEIQQFKKGFTHNNQNLYYINVSLNADGNAKIALMTSFKISSKDLENHTWHFDDYYNAFVECYDNLSVDSIYLWNGTAARELKRVLNLIEHHENDSSDMNNIQVNYIPTRSHNFDYHCQDPYGSSFYNNSRVFAAATYNYSAPNFVISHDDMCYCFDSYLGLGYDYINDNLYEDERPVCWIINIAVTPHVNNRWYIHYHQLHVEYGQLVSGNQSGNL